MKVGYYSDFQGLNRTRSQVDAPQISFVVLDNYIPNRIPGALWKRGGSTRWEVTGDVLGITSYSKISASLLVPNVETILRHRRSGSTSYIEKLDWSSGAWTAITQGAQTSFSGAGIMQAAQHGNQLLVTAGRPAHITDITSGNINRHGGPAPATAPTWGVGSAGPLTGQASGYYTFYDSTSGWESSPSPVHALVSIAGKQIDWSALETTVAKEGVSHKRLYRSQLGASGEPPYYFVAQVTLATTTYADTKVDTDLGAQGPDFNDHDPPPTSSYICAEYENGFWIASGQELWFSTTYDGSNVNLEYFSPDRVFRFPAVITGLVYTPDFGRLLVFLPPGQGIYAISGRSVDTFERTLYKKGEGTSFPSSISYRHDLIAFWGSRGPSLISPNGIVTNFSDSLSEFLREFITQEYDSDVWVWSVWHPILNQFLFGFGATESGVSQWADSVSGLSVGWEDSVTGATVEWQ